MNNDYEEFLDSPEWKAFSERIKDERGRKCELCGSPESLNVHHLIYRGNQMIDEDVIVLCRNCHECIERMIFKFRRKYQRSYVFDKDVMDKLFRQSVFDFYQNSFYKPASRSTCNGFDANFYSGFKELLMKQVKIRYPDIQVAYSPTKTYEFLYFGDHRRQLVEWRNAEIIDAIENGIPANSIKKRFRMSDNSWYKAVKRIESR